MRCAKSYQDIESPDDYKDNSDYFEEFIEKYVEKWGEQSDEDFDIIHLYWYNIVTDYLDESILDMSVNEMRESLVWYFKRSSEDRLKDIWVLQEQHRKQKEINKELVDENESLKEQIRKMKCCGNCAKNGHICVAEEMQGKLCGKNKDKWELRR